MEENIALSARLIHTIFYNDQNGYTVAKFVTYDDNEEDFTATGFFHNLNDEVVYNLKGNYTEHPRYGIQFQVQSYDVMQPNDKQSLIRYFSSPLFLGIGKQTAKQIVETLGEDVIQRIKEDGNVLHSVPSLSKKKIAIIVEAIREYDEVDDTVAFFTRYGISVKNIKKFEAVYGENVVSKIHENPYRLVEEVDGIGFKTADKLASELNFEQDHPYRIKAAVLSSVLQQCLVSGDTYVNYQQLEKRLHKDFDFGIDLNAYLDELTMERLLIVEEGHIYHHTQFDSEQGIASFLQQFPYEGQHKVDQEDALSQLQVFEDEIHIHYDTCQKQAITTFFDEAFSIITGGPGTGKTTIVQGILSLYRLYYPMDVISICAPTGRAAKRLGELSGFNATTIHSLLKWDLESNSFLINDSEPIQADLLVIDEFSMVDQWLFYNLIRACHNVKKILIIGDEDQLPSVGPGSVLKDLIDSLAFPVTRLKKIFRQSEGSDVITLAHEIHDEHITILDHANDVAFFSCENFEIREMVLQVTANALQKGYDAKDIQILAPMYGGVAGIDALNFALQKLMNPPDDIKREYKVGYRVFREGDKVLQLKNQPEDEVYNGDIGIIMEIGYAHENALQKTCITVDFDGTFVEYTNDQLYHITHAYCISIHKSQGSEYPIVIMPIVKDYVYMLSKRLLYTGVTRAKKSLVLLGSKQVFERSIQQKERHIRNSTLCERIRSYQV